jgi:hypothetical protein
MELAVLLDDLFQNSFVFPSFAVVLVSFSSKTKARSTVAFLGAGRVPSLGEFVFLENGAFFVVNRPQEGQVK